MSSKATRKQDAMARVREVQAILRRWDPIGVEPGKEAPADEYDTYAPVPPQNVSEGRHAAFRV